MIQVMWAIQLKTNSNCLSYTVRSITFKTRVKHQSMSDLTPDCFWNIFVHFSICQDMFHLILPWIRRFKFVFQLLKFTQIFPMASQQLKMFFKVLFKVIPFPFAFPSTSSFPFPLPPTPSLPFCFFYSFPFSIH